MRNGICSSRTSKPQPLVFRAYSSTTMSSAKGWAERSTAERIENMVLSRYSGAAFYSKAWRDTQLASAVQRRGLPG
jgi:hypothetical protein